MLEAVLDLKRRNVVVAANVECVRCDVFQGAFDFAGGGCYGSKDYPKAKEQADYNLKYRIAVALLDDQVGPAQLQPARIQAPDARGAPRRAFYSSLSQRAQCPNHDLHQRSADPGERATRLGGRSGQPYVMGPHRGEIPLAERTFR